ncbi:hypothetical protein QEG73_14320 [Chitinophagaceae bacterium 26-R-25]|nr:hypothetical protein [Chitinophagaceae bacterium 26-R-25]
MTIRKIILYSLIAPFSATTYYILYRLFKDYGMGQEYINAAVFIFFLLWIIAIFISLNLTLFSHNPRKKQFLFLGGQFAVILALAVIGVTKYFTNGENDKRNSQRNREFIEPHTENTTMDTYQRKAFEKLESAFHNPDDFELNAFYGDFKDTLTGKDSSRISYLYFQYQLNNSRTYFSKVRLFNDAADIEVFNGDPKEMPYGNLNLSDSQTKSTDSIIQQMPESQKEVFKKALERMRK